MISVEYRRTMTVINIIRLLLFCVSNTWSDGQVDVEYNNLNERDYEVKMLDNNDIYLTMYKYMLGDVEKVRIQLYYECLCPDCIGFDLNQFAPVVKTMSNYLDIHTYPFGNAEMIDDNGTVTFKCQHGPAECYGNKLHACAIDNLEHTTALLYNTCLMKTAYGKGSDDESADRCGQSMKIDSEKIKACAKGARGSQLLRFYGEESKKANFDYVPYVLINGKVFKDGDDFKKDVCAAFANPPPPCTNYYY